MLLRAAIQSASSSSSDSFLSPTTRPLVNCSTALNALGFSNARSCNKSAKEIDVIDDGFESGSDLDDKRLRGNGTMRLFATRPLPVSRRKRRLWIRARHN